MKKMKLFASVDAEKLVYTKYKIQNTKYNFFFSENNRKIFSFFS